MPRARPVRRPINENGLAYRRRLRNRNPQEAVEVNENINPFLKAYKAGLELGLQR
jgi:hypothetical protein